MICPKCQKPNEAGFRFCGHCGAELNPAQAVPPAPMQMPPAPPVQQWQQPPQQVSPPAYYPPPPAPQAAQIPMNLRAQGFGAGMVLLGILLPWYSLGFVGFSGFDIVTLGFNISRWGSMFGASLGNGTGSFLLAAILMILVALSGVTGLEAFTGSQRGRSRARRAGWIGLLVLAGLAVLLLTQIPIFFGIGFFVTLAGLICMISLGK